MVSLGLLLVALSTLGSSVDAAVAPGAEITPLRSGAIIKGG
jgi:hypothetical protein